MMQSTAMALANQNTKQTKGPHCKVCNDEASGFHYGVDSCEGCKGFFRRCITQGMSHRCSNEEKCEITPFSRNSCQFCRLKKCFVVGMSREASRLGRRPKKMKEVANFSSPPAIKEEKYCVQLNRSSPSSSNDSENKQVDVRVLEQLKVEMNRLQKSQLTTTTPIAPPPPAGSSLMNASPPFRCNEQQTVSLTDELGYKTDETGYSSYSNSPSTKTETFSDQEFQMIMSSMKEEKLQDVHTPRTQPITKDILDNLLASARRLPNNYELIDMIIDETKSAHVNTCRYTTNKVLQGYRNYQRIVMAQNTAAVSAFDNINLSASGLNRRDENSPISRPLQPMEAWKKFVENMVPAIERVVQFCKLLPGFKLLTQMDQIKLIKQGSFEVVMSRYLPLVDTHGEFMFSPHMDCKITRQVIKNMPMGGIMDQMFTGAKLLNPLQMDDTEASLFYAILMINPYRIGVVDLVQVTKLQHTFLQALYKYLQYSRRDCYEQHLEAMIQTIPKLAAINEDHSKALNCMTPMTPQEENVAQSLPLLHKEVYLSDDNP